MAAISWTDQDITQIWYPPYGYQRDKGIILGAYIWDDEPGLRYTAMTPAERLQAAIAEGEALHPGYSALIEAGVRSAWPKVRFQRGGGPPAIHPPACASPMERSTSPAIS